MKVCFKTSQARAITGEGRSRWYLGIDQRARLRLQNQRGLPCAFEEPSRPLTRSPLSRPPSGRSLSAGRSTMGSRSCCRGIPRFSTIPPVGNPDWKSGLSPNWFQLGFPSGFVADLLQNLEVLAELGHARDPGLINAMDFVLSRQICERPLEE